MFTIPTGYYTSHPPFSSKSHIAISAIGPTALAIEYAEVRIPHYLRCRHHSEALLPLLGRHPVLSAWMLSRIVETSDVGRLSFGHHKHVLV